MINTNLKNNIFPGLILALILGYASEFIHDLIVIGGQKPVSAVIIAILLGILIKNTIGVGESFNAGISFSLKKVLKTAIILLGIKLSFVAVITTGAKALVIILICVAFALTITYYIGKKLGLPDRLATLIGIGCAICGTTAIVATAPAIDAEDEDVTFSVATITLFGILAIFIYPILGKIMSLTDMQFGTWAGIAVHETAQVVAAGFAYSDSAGDIATVVKLTRTTLLAPMVLILGIIYARRKQQDEPTTKVNYVQIFPWFVLGFLAMAGFRTYGDSVWATSEYWPVLIKQTKNLSGLLIVTAMAGVGLLTSFEQLKKVGMKPFMVGLVASTIMAGFSFGLIFFMGI